MSTVRRPDLYIVVCVLVGLMFAAAVVGILVKNNIDEDNRRDRDAEIVGLAIFCIDHPEHDLCEVP